MVGISLQNQIFRGSSIITGGLCPKAVNWAARVVTNGGAAPADSTVQALSTFCYALDANGLTSLILTCNCYAPDNLIAACTPLIAGAFNDPWANNNFVSGDLTINGLAGDGSTKWLDPNFVPSTAWANDTSASLICQLQTLGGLVKGEMGSVSGGANAALYASYSGTAYWDCWNQSGGRISAANNAGCFLCATRTSSTASAIYVGTTAGGLVTLVSNTSESSVGSRPNWKSGVHAHINSSDTVQNASTARFSFAAFGLAMTNTQAQNLFNAVNAMRVAIGGGFV
jgi:hypothetical protein